jgi:hypothetical protein
MMLYAQENHGHYPRTWYERFSGERNFFSTYGYDPPFATDANGRPSAGAPLVNDVTAAYFLLVHYNFVPPDAFVCPSTDHEKDPLLRPGDAPWKRGAALRSNFIVTDPLGKDFSYSFANPYPGMGRLNVLEPTYEFRPTAPADQALAADRNDGQRLSSSDPDAGQAKIRPMNSSNHRRKGQNVLFNDCHVSWEDTPFCGHARDNIYTRSDHPENGSSVPASKDDSVLSPLFPVKSQIGS